MEMLTVFLPDGSLLATSAVLTAAALMFMYTFVGICAGFGGALTTMPLVTMLLPVQMATPISVIVGTSTALYATILDRKQVNWKSAAVLIGFSFAGIPVGLYILKNAPDYMMKGGLGVFLIVYALYCIFAPKMPKYDKEWIAGPFGLLAGGLGAAFSTNGPPVVLYGTLRDLAPSAFRGTLNAFFTANNIAIVGGLFGSGLLTIDVFKMIALSIPFMIAGSLIGNMVHKRIPAEKFKKLVFALLLASGIMLVKGALGL
jgi:uncharacterized membrane protein YfcA